MKKIIAMVALVFSCMLAYAQTNGEVIVMNKAMFIKDVFDYEKSQDWKYVSNLLEDLLIVCIDVVVLN